MSKIISEIQPETMEKGRRGEGEQILALNFVSQEGQKWQEVCWVLGKYFFCLRQYRDCQ